MQKSLNNNFAGIHGLWIDTQNCADHAAGAIKETQGAGISGDGAERIRLPSQIEQDFWEFAADAQRVMIQYEALRKTCLPLVEVMPDTNG